MRRKNVVKAGFLLGILLLVLPASVVSVQAVLSIGPVTGPIGVRTTISSTTTEIDVLWTIQIDGGWIFNSRTTTGVFASIGPNTPETIQTIPFGIGGIFRINPITVTVTTIPPATPPTTPGPTHLFIIFTW